MSLYSKNAGFNRYVPRKKAPQNGENVKTTSSHTSPNDETPKKARVLSIANQKGGVGKTTTAINLATAMVAVGKKVLLIDLDPQGNATTGVGLRKTKSDQSIYHVLFDGLPLHRVSRATSIPRLDVIPSSIQLASADIELVNIPKREYRLKQALAERQADTRLDAYDYVLIDCPPSLNLVTLNALVASNSVLVPLQCEFFALEGLSQLTHTIDRVRRTFNPDLELEGVLLTMYDKRNNLSLSVADDVRKYFGDKVFETIIPRNVRMSEAPSHGLPAIIYDMKCAGSRAYMSLAKEILARMTRGALGQRSPHLATVSHETSSPTLPTAA